MNIMKKKLWESDIFKANKLKRGKRAQKKSFFNKITRKCYLYNLIVILGLASKSP